MLVKKYRQAMKENIMLTVREIYNTTQQINRQPRRYKVSFYFQRRPSICLIMMLLMIPWTEKVPLRSEMTKLLELRCP